MSSQLDVDVAIQSHAWELAHVRFTGSPGDWLGEDARRIIGDWQTHVPLGRLRRPVRVTIGDCQATGSTLWRRFCWVPRRKGLDHTMIPDPRLPSFIGRLGLQETPVTALRLCGSYEPPLGPVGNLVDQLVLRKVAELSAVQLLSELATRLTAPLPVSIRVP